MTPLNPLHLPGEGGEFGQRSSWPRRAAVSDEIAPTYVFFTAPQLASYYSGEVLDPTGGETLAA